VQPVNKDKTNNGQKSILFFEKIYAETIRYNTIFFGIYFTSNCTTTSNQSLSIELFNAAKEKYFFLFDPPSKKKSGKSTVLFPL